LIRIYLKISKVPSKAKSQKPAYSQALIQNKIDRHGFKIWRFREADSQMAMVDDVWS